MNRSLMVVILVLALSLPSNSHADSAYPGSITLEQPDGTPILARQYGDELAGVVETEEGYTIVQHTDGWWHYVVAQTTEGWQLSTFVAGKGDPVSAGIPKHILPRPTASERTMLRAKRIGTRAATVSPITGHIEVVVLRIDFPDKVGATPRNSHNLLLFGGSFGSMDHYYSEISRGALTVKGKVFPASDTWYRSRRKITYYGPDSPSGGRDNLNAPIYVLAAEAVTLADPDMNFADYDLNHDGQIDYLIVIHAGNNQASSGQPNDIWSTAWSSPIGPTVDGVRLTNFAVVSETSPMGTFAHEFAHEFGAPDLYDTDPAGRDEYPVGVWCIMGGGEWFSGGMMPANMSGYLRWDIDGDPSNGIRGWIPVTTLTTSQSQVAIQAAEIGTDPALMRIDLPGTHQYFLIENRQKLGYDLSLPDNGLVIYHIDEDMPDNDGHPKYPFDRVWVEDPVDLTHANPPSATFTAGRSFTPSTKPNSNANDGTPSGISVTNISPSNRTMTFDVTRGVSVVSARQMSATTIELRWTAPPSSDAALAGHYTITGGPAVNRAEQKGDRMTLTLALGLKEGTAFTLTVSGIAGLVPDPTKVNVDVFGTIVTAEKIDNADVTWTPEEGPYYLNTDFTIGTTGRLTIMPGVTVKFAGTGSHLFDYGILDVRGTAEKPVVFSSSSPSPGSWGGIRLIKNDRSRIDFCTVEYADNGIQCDSSSVTISNSTIRQCRGTGILTTVSRLEILKTIIAENGQDGVGMYGGSSLSMRESTIQENGRGGITFFASSGTIEKNLIAGNTLAGITVTKDSVLIRENTIRENGSDGMTFFNGTGRVIKNVIVKNAQDGIDVARDSVAVTVTENTIQENGRNGMTFFAGLGTITGNLITDNIKSGIESQNARLIIDGNRLLGNRGNGIGSFSSGLKITNTLIAKNAAFGLAFQDVSSITIAGSTIDDNEWGIACFKGASPSIWNTIIWGNRKGAVGFGDALSSVTVNFSDVQGGYPADSRWRGGSGILVVDPLFVDVGKGDYHLTASSPCIDSGTKSDAPTTDLDGRPRTGVPDIGAYEFVVLAELRARFAATPDGGVAPLRVQLSDSSTGIITSRQWNFGDGQTGTEQNPVHTYTAPGRYTITLKVTGPDGNNAVMKTVVVTKRQIVRLVIRPTQLAGGTTFTNKQLSIKAGSTITFAVDGIYGDSSKVAITPIWKVVGDIGTISTAGLFTVGKKGGNRGGIVASAEGMRDSIGVTLLPGPVKQLTIKPAIVKLKPGQQVVFTAAGVDEFNNAISGLKPVWHTVGKIGTINRLTGIFKAGTTLGTGYVIAFAGSSPNSTISEGIFGDVQAGISGSAKVVVEQELPTLYALSQNFPNPFNGETVIGYDLPELAHVRLFVHDLTGRVIRTLVRQPQQQGRYRVVWDGRDEEGREVASGVYLYRIEAVDRRFVETKRLLLLR